MRQAQCKDVADMPAAIDKFETELRTFKGVPQPNFQRC